MLAAPHATGSDADLGFDELGHNGVLGLPQMIRREPFERNLGTLPAWPYPASR